MNSKKENTRLLGLKRFIMAMMIILVTFLLLLITGEITVRIMGYQPWDPPQRNTRVEPEGSFFQKDSLLGYSHKPGKYTLILNDALTFTANIDSMGNRTTCHIPDSVRQREIWIMGGSFTFGWGVEDEEAFPALLGCVDEFKIQVRNFGVGGYGTLQSLLQLKKHAQSGKPDNVILVYASFHDQRNTCNQYWLKAIAPHTVLEGLSFPYARIEGDGLRYGLQPVEYKPIVFSDKLAFFNFWDEQSCQNQESRLQSNWVSRMLIREMWEYCKQNGIEFILAGISDDHQTRDVLQEMKQEGLKTFDISVDLQRPENNLEPADPHPSQKAHREYAKGLLK